MTSTERAAAHFAAKLEFETDPTDVHQALESGTAGYVLIDTRNDEAWAQGHARGAVHMPRSEMSTRIPAEFDRDANFVVYCWGPACNGATRAGLILSEMGYAVKEMIGGFEYWAREGLPVDRSGVNEVGEQVIIDATRPVDPLTAPAVVAGQRIACDC